MKNIVIIILGVILFACNQGDPKEENPLVKKITKKWKIVYVNDLDLRLNQLDSLLKVSPSSVNMEEYESVKRKYDDIKKSVFDFKIDSTVTITGPDPDKQFWKINTEGSKIFFLKTDRTTLISECKIISLSDSSFTLVDNVGDEFRMKVLPE